MGSHFSVSPLFKRTLAALLGVVALNCAQAQTLLPSTVSSIKPTGGLWSSGDGFAFDLGKQKAIKVRQSVSGMACNRRAEPDPLCLVVFDEGAQARYATLQNGRLVMDGESVLFPGVAGELDAEAAATDGRHVYVAGSHSAKRSDCRSNPHSRQVIRMALDPHTGRALSSSYTRTGRLWPLMQALPALAPHVGEGLCLGEAPEGINIEGMAIRSGRLYVGFRSPVVNDASFVLALDADALFGSADPKATVSRLALGANRGIRDMVAVSSGFLILAGPDDTKTDLAANAHPGTGWTFFWWDGQPSEAVVYPKPLGSLDLTQVKLRKCDKALKPESFTVLAETPRFWRLLVLSDGLCDGGPLEFNVAR